MNPEILLDANFLLLPHKNKIDVFEEIPKLLDEKHEYVTLESIVGELVKLSDGASDDAAAAKTALKLIKAKEVKVAESAGEGDAAIRDYAMKHENTVVCTNDRELKRELKARGVKTISLQGADKLTTI